MDDVKIQELRVLHNDLARLLSQQHEVILSTANVVGAIRQTLEGDPALSKKYAANLESLKLNAQLQPNPMQAGVLQGLLRRLREW
jgi:hypothetical protein